MNLEELKALEPIELVKELKSGRLTEPRDLKEIYSAIDVKKHKVFDPTIRKDKMVKMDDGSSRLEPVQRTGFGLQKLIIKREVAFLFGNPVEYSSTSENSEDIVESFKAVLEDAKIDSFNRKIARDLFSTTEVAELWFPVPTVDEEGKNTFKLRVKKLSLLTGDKLYPYFDEYGDLIAFSREYKIKDETFLETYTDEQIWKYNTSKEAEIVEGYPLLNTIKKIPVVYASQQNTSYDDVTDLIDRLERLMSNFGDTNDYHAAPKLFIKGTIKGFSKKGESGTIIEGDANTTAQYLSWTNAPESVKLEISTLKEMIYTISQTPDISFESLKGSGVSGLSGKALKLMFLDAHLKVMDNMEVFDEYLQRRTNIIKAFMSQIDTTLEKSIKATKINAEVTPYMMDDLSDNLEFLMTATGNKPVLSQKTAVKMSGLVVNSDDEYSLIKEESSVDSFEPTDL